MLPEERAKILWKMMAFVRKTPFSQQTFVVEKKHINDEIELVQQFVRQFSDFIKQYYPYFLSFDKIKVYYDNGQFGVMQVLIAVFTTLFNNVEFRKATQKDYKLLQVADLVCTAELTRLKLATHTISKSEKRVLGNDRDINKRLIKPLQKKKFGGK